MMAARFVRSVLQHLYAVPSYCLRTSALSVPYIVSYDGIHVYLYVDAVRRSLYRTYISPSLSPVGAYVLVWCCVSFPCILSFVVLILALRFYHLRRRLLGLFAHWVRCSMCLLLLFRNVLLSRSPLLLSRTCALVACAVTFACVSGLLYVCFAVKFCALVSYASMVCHCMGFPTCKWWVRLCLDLPYIVSQCSLYASCVVLCDPLPFSLGPSDTAHSGVSRWCSCTASMVGNCAFCLRISYPCICV